MADRRSLSSSSDTDADSILSVGTIATSSRTSQHSSQELHHAESRQSQAAKALQLGEENTPRTPSLRSVSGSVATRSSYRTDSLFRAGFGAAPPNYAEALAQSPPVWSPAADVDSLYAVSEDGSLDAAFLPGKYKGLRRFLERHWKSLALLNLGIYCIFATVILVVGLQSSRRVEYVREFDFIPPDHPNNDLEHPERFHQNTSQCTFTKFGSSFEDEPFDGLHFLFSEFEYADPKTLIFEEALRAEYQALGDISIVGNVEVRPGTYAQWHPVEIHISFATSSNWRGGFPAAFHDMETLRLFRGASDMILPRQSDVRQFSLDASEGGKACLSIWIGIYILSPLDNFHIHTENLNVDIGAWPHKGRDRWSPWVRNDSSIYTNAGNITTSYWGARSTNITSEKGSIKGEFELNDNLHIEAKTGDIDVAIRQRAAYAKPYWTSRPSGVPAILSIITRAGRQVVEYYQQLGDLLLSVGHGIGNPFRSLSFHRSDSGNISITTSYYWEGRIRGQSENGSVDFRGTDLEILDPPINKINTKTERWAKQGRYHEGLMDIATKSGNISLCATINSGECSQHFPEFSHAMDQDGWFYRDMRRHGRSAVPGIANSSRVDKYRMIP